jgi:glycosyltransferase involved in cell wall biosynthesis
MLEMLACGKPIVSTDVSGTRAMIRHGVNGFIVGRDPVRFAAAAADALNLSDARAASLAVARQFSVETLASDLSAIWPPVAGGES